jgi:L-iditol 2-dehydrogenase
MKALRFFEPGRVGIVDIPEPNAGPGEVVLKVHATGLCNSDVRVYLGEKKAAAGVIPGHEMTGEIAEVGAGANAITGDVVSVCPILCCGHCSFCRDGFRNRCLSRRTLGYDLDGAIAEYVRIPAPLVAMGQLLPMDPATPAHLRALLEPFACVLNSIESLSITPGRAVAMAVGLSQAVPLALGLARRLGAVNLFAGFPPGSAHTFDLNRIHYDEVRILGTQNAPFHLYGTAARLIPRLPQLDRVVTNRYSLANAAQAYTDRLGKSGLKSAVVV